ncbi:GntR family transcriptional regulator [Vagococcus entomophilus]|uniref:GntR family transcriptional regulator n=1 Tax=Vagococcus entomophilus TaxID=1160095 RepID=A0A430AJH5_9ENTE|nr:TrkA C-terminal domain-containing protein [Vagococcus entomophilus]RSU08208.1 GntR family transcriptional regulator [Vagococcus entomophilus]
MNGNKQKLKVSRPRYQQIAADLAAKIVDNKYKLGDKLSARSTIAGQYSVSPETARRAIQVLVDLDIVASRHGSGAYITSYTNAQNFVKQFSDIQTLDELKKEINDSVIRQRNELASFNNSLNKLIDQTERFRYLNPLNPYQLEITDNMLYLNQTIQEINFWHNTTATLVAIKRGPDFFISPGPYAQLFSGDIIYFVGNSSALQFVQNFLYPQEN